MTAPISFRLSWIDWWRRSRFRSTLYIYIDFRFITFRAAGDQVDRATFDRLLFKKVRYLFVKEGDLKAFLDWSQKQARDLQPPNTDPETKSLDVAKKEARRRMLDIFQEDHPDQHITQAIEASRRIVDEIMKFPFTVTPLSQLQTYSQRHGGPLGQRQHPERLPRHPDGLLAQR